MYLSHPETIGPFTLHQAPGVFPLGGDSLALGAFAQVRRGERMCDLGCGSGALTLMLLAREPSLRVTALELDPAAAQLARGNFRSNGLDVRLVQGDLRQARQLFPCGSFDLAVSNPPYFPANAGPAGGPGRREDSCTLLQLCQAVGWLVKNGGRFALVYRPERLCELFAALRQYDLEPKRMQLLQAEDRPPSAVLLEAYKQGRPGLQILPTLSPQWI
ncbi:MAG: methyltransferase [Oscillospiraceae bacterium]|nr:methyltransferase [Oscillospiraceae bacterium]